MKKIAMTPAPGTMKGPQTESGIRRVVEAYAKHLPKFGWEVVDPKADTRYDLLVAHAGIVPGADIAHIHGLYWTADYAAERYEWKANAQIISNIRSARVITVPSRWVSETFERDMHFSPIVLGHGIDWEDWQGVSGSENRGYVLWNKNRAGDVCDPRPGFELAQAHPDIPFVMTFAPKVANFSGEYPRNLTVTGVMEHQRMKALVQRAGVYLATTKETFGIGILEAMASGVPVLGFRHGGVVDLVEHGVNGYLAEPGNQEDLAEGLAYCLRHRRTLGENGREMARQWTWESVVSRLARIYDSALTGEPATVSVIIPCYNYANVVGRAIESVLNQTYPVDEVVVVDDGSTDDGETERVVRSYSARDPRVSYIRIENSGVAVARNTGIDSVRSKYVCCLDADDRIEPAFLERTISALESDRSLWIAYTGLKWVRPDGSTGVSEWPGDYDFDKFLRRQNQVPTCAVFRRELWVRLGGYRQRYAPTGAGAEDAEFWLRAGAYGYRAAKVTEEPLFVYSFQSGRVSGNKDYREVDWLAWHPWARDEMHPAFSLATPRFYSHPVRQYDEPLITVIVPVGPGHVDKLWNALDSLEAQTMRKWEVIVVWDCEMSPLRKRIEDAYPFARFVSTGAGGSAGAGAARNTGARAARAPFLLFLDADDWLYPEALEKMYAAWVREHAVIYSDYMSKAIMSAGQARAFAQAYGDKLVHYDDHAQEAVILSGGADYDCERAQRQPENPLYIWNLITSLVPRAWHEEIGGFDETMESWEDWDYWLRLARAGKCFYRIPEPLVVYRFYTGSRRALAAADTDAGRQLGQRLLKYLANKYKEIKVMPCGSCGGSRPKSGTAIRDRARIAGAGQVLSGRGGEIVNDNDMVEIIYRSPNMGAHSVVGSVTRINYGYRVPGDRFLVHVADIKAQPRDFIRAADARVTAPRVERQTPPPQPLTAAAAPAAAEAVVQAPADEDGLDLQSIPGVTAEVAAALAKKGVTTLENIVELGEAGLKSVKGIGDARARTIFTYAKKKLALG